MSSGARAKTAFQPSSTPRLAFRLAIAADPQTSSPFVNQPRDPNAVPAQVAPLLRRLLDVRGRWSKGELGLLLLCPVLLLGTALVTERWQLRGHVMEGVQLDGEPIAGLSEQALRDELESRNEHLTSRVLRWRVGDAVFRVGASELGAAIEVDSLVRALMSAGRQGNLLQQLWWRMRRGFESDGHSSRVSFDERLWEGELQAYERAVLTRPLEGSLSYEDGKLQRTEPQAGQLIERNGARELLLTALHQPQQTDATLPLEPRQPQTSRKSVDEAEATARKLLQLPIAMEVQLPPEAAEEFAELDDSSRIEIFEEAELGPALRTKLADDGSGRLELYFDAASIAKLLEPLRKRWEQPARDASFDVKRGSKLEFEITPSQRQTRLAVENVAEALLRAGLTTQRRGTIDVVVGDAPRITTQVAENLGITGEVARFTTNHPCCRPRVKNIHRMADLIDGVIVLPGEVFSINEHVGPRTASKGFVPAPTIVHGEMSDTVGGGASQFATTIFNAVFNGGYEIIERQAHSYYFPRYPVGHEATLSFPKPDFIFRNDTKFGLLIKTEYGGTYIRVVLYGNNEGRKVARKVSPRFDYVDPPIEFEVDDGIDPNEAVVLERGSKGWSVLVSRFVTFADGEKKSEERKVVYQPKTRRVRIHSCKVPEGEPGYTGEDCPELELDAGVPPPASVELAADIDEGF